MLVGLAEGVRDLTEDIEWELPGGCVPDPYGWEVAYPGEQVRSWPVPYL